MKQLATASGGVRDACVRVVRRLLAATDASRAWCGVLSALVRSEDAKALGLEYCSLEEVLTTSDILSLHLPLLPDTYHIIGKQSIARMKKGVVIVNVSRGGLVDASAVIQGLKSGQIGGLAMDVYENEQSYFFSDCSDQVLSDDVLANLLTYPNVIITAHQAFLTSEALEVSLPSPPARPRETRVLFCCYGMSWSGGCLCRGLHPLLLSCHMRLHPTVCRSACNRGALSTRVRS